MTRQRALKRIRLQLARLKALPSSSEQHGYGLVAPLHGHGHIAPKLWRVHQEEWRVRRFWDDEENATGLLIRKPGGAEHAR